MYLLYQKEKNLYNKRKDTFIGIGCTILEKGTTI